MRPTPSAFSAAGARSGSRRREKPSSARSKASSPRRRRDCTIIIEAGALKKDAPLRRLCEREKNAAAIECYADSAQDLAHLIDAEAAGANIAIAPEAKTLLVSLLGQDRLATRAELSKLFLYAHGADEIGVEHIEAIVSDAGGLMVDHAVDNAFDGDFAAFEGSARRALTQGADARSLLGVALRHALGLRRARLDVEAGRRRGLQGGGWSRSRSFDAHLRAWTAARLTRAVEILAEAMNKARREPKLAEAIALRALWRVASSARARPTSPLEGPPAKRERTAPQRSSLRCFAACRRHSPRPGLRRKISYVSNPFAVGARPLCFAASRLPSSVSRF